MLLDLLNDRGEVSSSFDAPDLLFAREYNESLIHQLVVAYQANARQGTRAQKDRATVAHTTKKPWRQKGTGRARAGMSSSPIWRGGGRIFPNSPTENFSQKVNRKMYRAAMASIFSQLVREGRLGVIEYLNVNSPKTKDFITKCKMLGLVSGLVIVDQLSENLFLASRNIPNILVVESRYADPLSLLYYDRVLITQSVIAHLSEMLL